MHIPQLALYASGLLGSLAVAGPVPPAAYAVPSPPAGLSSVASVSAPLTSVVPSVVPSSVPVVSTVPTATAAVEDEDEDLEDATDDYKTPVVSTVPEPPVKPQAVDGSPIVSAPSVPASSVANTVPTAKVANEYAPPVVVPKPTAITARQAELPAVTKSQSVAVPTAVSSIVKSAVPSVPSAVPSAITSAVSSVVSQITSAANQVHARAVPTDLPDASAIVSSVMSSVFKSVKPPVPTGIPEAEGGPEMRVARRAFGYVVTSPVFLRHPLADLISSTATKGRQASAPERKPPPSDRLAV